MSKKSPIDTFIWINVHRRDVPFFTHPPYQPLHVGKALASFDIPGTIGDDTGDNISDRNLLYGEATGHYWAWKNIPAAIRYAGHGQYRRYFDFELPPKRFNIAAQTYFAQEHALPDFEQLFKHYDIVLPPIVHIGQNPFDRYGTPDELLLVRQVIRDIHPDYVTDFDRYFLYGNRFRYDYLFIAPRGIVDDYSAWIFDILLEMERRMERYAIPIRNRLFNYIGEALTEVYALHNRLRVCEAAVVFTDGVGTRLVQTRVGQWWKTLRFRFTQPARLRKQKRAIRQFENNHQKVGYGKI